MISIIFIMAFAGGLIYGFIKPLNTPQNTPIMYKHKPPPEVPYYIGDKLNAYDALIESYTTLLYSLDRSYEQANTPQERARIRARQAEIQLKISNTTEKADKLRIKYDL